MKATSAKDVLALIQSLLNETQDCDEGGPLEECNYFFVEANGDFSLVVMGEDTKESVTFSLSVREVERKALPPVEWVVRDGRYVAVVR